MSIKAKLEAPLTAYDKADEYLRKQLPHSGIEQMNAVKLMVYRKIESGKHYFKACHEALQRIKL